jgi:ribose transport system permease protein
MADAAPPAATPHEYVRPSRIRRTISAARSEGWIELLFLPVVIVGLAVYFSSASPYFLTSYNLTNLFVQGAILAFVAFGVTFVILLGELDLSVGSGVALVSVCAADVMQHSNSIVLGIVVGLAVGVAIGAINGLVVTVLEVPSFIATFGMLTIAHGIALAMTNGGVIAPIPFSIGNLANQGFLGVRWILWLVIFVFVVLYFVQTQTAFGRRVFAIGGNREAARLAGIPVGRVRFMTFALSGLTMAIGGIALTARVVSGQPNGGELLELDAVTAIVIGGTSIFGGRGSLIRTAQGVLLIAMLRNGLDLIGVNDDLKQVIIGAVLVAAASVGILRGGLRFPWHRASTTPGSATGQETPQPEAPTAVGG